MQFGFSGNATQAAEVQRFNGHLIQTPSDALRITAAARLQTAGQLALAYGQSAITPSSVRPVANSPARLRAVILCIVLFGATHDTCRSPTGSR